MAIRMFEGVACEKTPVAKKLVVGDNVKYLSNVEVTKVRRDWIQIKRADDTLFWTKKSTLHTI